MFELLTNTMISLILLCGFVGGVLLTLVILFVLGEI
jgi:hypothetical protein